MKKDHYFELVKVKFKEGKTQEGLQVFSDLGFSADEIIELCKEYLTSSITGAADLIKEMSEKEHRKITWSSVSYWDVIFYNAVTEISGELYTGGYYIKCLEKGRPKNIDYYFSWISLLQDFIKLRDYLKEVPAWRYIVKEIPGSRPRYFEGILNEMGFEALNFLELIYTSGVYEIPALTRLWKEIFHYLYIGIPEVADYRGLMQVKLEDLYSFTIVGPAGEVYGTNSPRVNVLMGKICSFVSLSSKTPITLGYLSKLGWKVLDKRRKPSDYGPVTGKQKHLIELYYNA